MGEPAIGPELKEVLELMIPAGQELRSFIEGWQYIQHGPPLPTSWNLLESIETERPATTKSGEVILWIRELSHLSHLGDDQAGSILAAIALEATLRLNMLMHKPNDVLFWVARHLKLWPVIYSSFPTLCTVQPDVDGAEHSAQAATARFSPTATATFMAGVTLAFMQLVRSGERHPSNRVWGDQVRKLPPISSKTVHTWWALAKQEIYAQYPDLAEVVLGHVLVGEDIQRTNGEALRRIRYPFLKSVWKVLAEQPAAQTKPGSDTKAKVELHAKHKAC